MYFLGTLQIEIASQANKFICHISYINILSKWIIWILFFRDFFIVLGATKNPSATASGAIM